MASVFLSLFFSKGSGDSYSNPDNIIPFYGISVPSQVSVTPVPGWPHTGAAVIIAFAVGVLIMFSRLTVSDGEPLVVVVLMVV
jgi:hypothetical protein